MIMTRQLGMDGGEVVVWLPSYAFAVKLIGPRHTAMMRSGASPGLA